MSVDPLAALAERLAAPILADLAALRADVARLEERLAVASTPPALEPLAAILGCTPAAARMREARDAALRSLAVEVGRRRMYRRDEVLRLLRDRVAGRRTLRAIGGRP